jgi:hypothetical protein
MITNITFFDTREELRALTGLPDDNYDQALWDAGFNLDDVDFGFVSDVLLDRETSSTYHSEWTGEDIVESERSTNWDLPYYASWLIDHAANHCVGYDYVNFGGKHYYLVHHA